MRTISARRFRAEWSTLTEPVEIVVYGRSRGTFYPPGADGHMGNSPQARPTEQASPARASRAMTQADRDRILRRINREH
jgi:hypothetical protein